MTSSTNHMLSVMGSSVSTPTQHVSHPSETHNLKKVTEATEVKNGTVQVEPKKDNDNKEHRPGQSMSEVLTLCLSPKKILDYSPNK